MNITDFRRSSARIILGAASDSTSWGGVSLSSNGIPTAGWGLVAIGSNQAIWRDVFSFGSNTNDVGSVGTMGASPSNSRADHVHRGVSSVTSSSSNTLYGKVNLRVTGAMGIALDVPTNTITLSSSGSGSGVGAGSGTAAIVGVKARASSGSFGSGSYAAVPFAGTDDWDTDAFHDPSSNNTRITIPSGKDGTYLVEYTIVNGSATGASYIRLNGTTAIWVYGWPQGSGAGNVVFRGLAVLALVATDYIEVMCSASSSTVTADTYFSATLIGA